MTGTLDTSRLLDHSESLQHLAFELVRDHELAQDVVQETWLTALTRPPRDTSSEAGVRAWLGRVAHNVVRMHIRSESRRRRREAAVARPESTDDRVEQITVQRNLADSVLALDPPDREVVVMRFFDNLPPREIAKRLGTTGPAVRSRLTRALGKLRARLDERHGRDGRAWATALVGMLPRRMTGRAVLATAMGVAALPLLGIAAVLAIGFTIWSGSAADAQPLDTPHTDAPAAIASHVETEDASDAPHSENIPTERDVVESKDEPTHPEAAAPKMIVLARCLDHRDQPIQGVAMVAHEIQDEPSAETGPDGRARLELTWPPKRTSGNNHWVAVEFRGDGWSRTSRQEKVDGVTTMQLGDVRLQPGGTITGRVLLPSGAPATGAWISAIRGTTRASGEAEELRRVLGHGFRYGIRGPGRTKTDDNGEYRLEGVDVTSVSMLARKSGHYIEYGAPFDVRHADEVRAPDLILTTLSDRNKIRGVVLDEDGKGVQTELNVWENRGARNSNPVTMSFSGASDGAFELVVPAGRPYTIEARQRNASRLILRHDVTAGMHDVEMRFPAKRWMTIDPRSTNGDRILATRVSVADAASYMMRTPVEENDDGTRRMLMPAIPFQLWVNAEGHLAHHEGPLDPKTAPEQLRPTLQRAGAIRGRVLADGQPVAGARVHLHFRAHKKRMGVYAAKLYTRLHGYVRYKGVLTDENGRFEHFVRSAGEYYVHAEAEGWARGEHGPFRLDNGESANDLTFELVRPATLEGRLLVAEGVEVDGALVAITHGDGHLQMQFVGADGRYRFEGLTPGDWQIARCEPDQQEWLRTCRTWTYDQVYELPVHFSVRAGETKTHDLDLTADRPTAIRGRVVIDDAPREGVHVNIAYTKVRTKTDADGGFELVAPRPGALELYVSYSLPHGDVSATIEAKALEDGTPIDIRVKTGAVEVRDLPQPARADVEDAAMPSFALVRTSDGIQWAVRFDPDASGVFRSKRIPRGEYEIRARQSRRSYRWRSWAVIGTARVE